ncbi:MAG: hypothetical protein M0R32_09400 [Candidatus Cloacimonetes bacterium]|jgi:hypothetical protein|nr:hypothetical protein [Candidatus Cloacimonadota bacterium]
MAELKKHYGKIPPHMLEDLNRYATDHVLSGNFLYALLSNDLSKSFSYADSETMNAMYDYVQYVFNYLPLQCWGSKEKVDDWLDKSQSE